MKLMETTLPHNYSKGLFEEKYFDLAPEHTDKIFTVLFTATSNILKHAKKKEKPVSFEFNTIEGHVLAAAIVRFFENEDPSKPGNWNLVWTFDEKDIPEDCQRISIKEPETHQYFRGIAGEKFGITFRTPESLIVLMTYLLEQLRKWLDENAKENEVVMIEQDAIFQARVAVEDGVKVFALEPAGEIKMLIKDDTAIEK